MEIWDSLDNIMKLGFDLYFEMWKKGEISIRKAAKILEISPATFYRRCKELDETKRNK